MEFLWAVLGPSWAVLRLSCAVFFTSSFVLGALAVQDLSYHRPFESLGVKSLLRHRSLLGALLFRDCYVAARTWELWCRVVYVTLRSWEPWSSQLVYVTTRCSEPWCEELLRDRSPPCLGCRSEACAVFAGISGEAYRGPLGGSFEAAWGPFRGLFWASWGALGASWGASWGHLGGLSGASWGFLEPS